MVIIPTDATAIFTSILPMQSMDEITNFVPTEKGERENERYTHIHASNYVAISY
jgi:hypothetical protein